METTIREKHEFDDVPKPILKPWQINILGLGLVILTIIVSYLTYSLWSSTSNADNDAILTTKLLTGNDITISAEHRILSLVMLSGALGSLIHAISSFSNYVGQGKIERSWIWWYVLRPFLGMSLAFIFYMIFRGGLLNNTKSENLNLYGILTMAALVGLFTDRATLKLEEVFQSLFQPKDTRQGKLEEKVPQMVDESGANG